MSGAGADPSDRTSEPGRLSPAGRRAAVAAARTGRFDIVVVGGGVTGAGVALDAASRGLSVVLVEAGDLASGTSSRSGKTVHGGLRGRVLGITPDGDGNVWLATDGGGLARWRHGSPKAGRRLAWAKKLRTSKGLRFPNRRPRRAASKAW